MTKQISPTRPRRNELRERAARQRRQQNVLLISAGAVVVALLALVIWLNIRSTRPIMGEVSFPTQGNSHIPQGSRSPIEYNSVPPTSGPHYDPLVSWNIYDTPFPYEEVIHNMEDGGVLIYYQCPEGCPEMVEELRTIVQPYINAGRHVVMLPNLPGWTGDGATPLHKDMGARISLNAWQKQIKLDSVDADRIRRFVDRYEGIDHHVQGQG
jgi:hypothetical protein